jgi:hypothetical protein
MTFVKRLWNCRRRHHLLDALPAGSRANDALALLGLLLRGTSRVSLSNENYVASFDRDIGIRPSRNADIGSHERRRVVDTVRDHRYRGAHAEK